MLSSGSHGYSRVFSTVSLGFSLVYSGVFFFYGLIGFSLIV